MIGTEQRVLLDNHIVKLIYSGKTPVDDVFTLTSCTSAWFATKLFGNVKFVNSLILNVTTYWEVMMRLFYFKKMCATGNADAQALMSRV